MEQLSLLPQLAGPWVDVRAFAPPEYPRVDCPQIDWQPYIQAAVDYLLTSSLENFVFDSNHKAFPAPTRVATLYFPPGRYRISAPIIIAVTIDDVKSPKNPDPSPTGKRYTFCSIQLMGDAPPYGNGIHASAIITSFSDRPALCIELARAVKIQNLAFEGNNDWVANHNPRDMVTHYNDACYLKENVRDERYSPYCAICIDPFTRYHEPKPPLPPDGGYPSMAEHYHPAGAYTNAGSGSSWVQIESCAIHGFAVGIAISPNGLTQNAENIAITDCTVSSVKTALAVCQAQSRNVILRNFSAEGAKYVINCTDYGQGGGNCPSIFGANLGGAKYLFKTFSSGSTPSINGLYCEACLSIGILGGNGASDGYVFNACNFGLVGTPIQSAVPVKPAVFRLLNFARAVFTGCAISASRYPAPDGPADVAGVVTPEPLWLLCLGWTTFTNCALGGYGSDSAPRLWVTGAPERVAFHDCYTHDTPYDITPKPDPTSGPVEIPPVSQLGYFGQVIRLRFSNVQNTTVLPGAFMYSQNNAVPPTGLRWVDSQLPYVLLGPTITVTSNGDGTGSFTLPAAAVGLVAPGDVIHGSSVPYYYPIEAPYHQAPLEVQYGRVVHIDPVSHLVTLHYVLEGAPPVQTYQYLSGCYLPRIHAATTGDFDPAQPSLITKVSAPSMWRVNERIRDAAGRIMEGTYITDITGSTFTLSRPWSGAQACGVALYDAKVSAITMTPLYSQDPDQGC